MAEVPAPREGIVLTHFIVADDVERSRRFYTDVLGGETVLYGDPYNVTHANRLDTQPETTVTQESFPWNQTIIDERHGAVARIITNAGGGPTDDKPTITLVTPPDPDRVSSFLNVRVADIHAVYDDWKARGATFLTPPTDRGREIRCYVRDPDGHLIEVGQLTDESQPSSGTTR